MKRLLTAFIGVAAVSLSVYADGDPSVQVGANRIVVSNVSPGATIAVYGIAVDRFDQMDHIRRFVKANVDDDRDGIVTVDVPGGVVQPSVWVAADTRSGRFTVVNGDGSDLRPGRSVAQPFTKRLTSVDQYAVGETFVEAIYIHPGDGVWTWSAIDNGADDVDRAHGRTAVTLSHGKAALEGQSQPPSEFKFGGTVIAVQPLTLQVVITRVTREVLRGAQ